MATYPIKMLKDEEGKPFVPLINIDAIKELGGDSLMEIIEGKLEVTNIIAGRQIDLDVDGNNITINNSAEGTKLINNLDTTISGTGALDAAQGKVLKDSIPEVINNLTTIDSKKALSAHQGYVLAGRSVPVGGGTGQVLMKSADDDYSLTWGDAADPNAIVGDGSIKKIVELTYEEYTALEDQNKIEPTVEYHISDWNEQGGTYITENEIQNMIESNVVNNLTTTNDSKSLSANQGVVINDKFNNIGQFTHRDDNTVSGTLASSSNYSHLFSFKNTSNYRRIGIIHAYIRYDANVNGDRALAITSNENKQLAAIQCKGCVDGNTSRLTTSYPMVMAEGETVYVDGFQSSDTSLGYELIVKFLWFDTRE